MASDGNGAVLPPGILPVRATPEDADTFIGIHEEVARWLWDRGIPQWEPGTFQRAWILGPIKRGELYLAKSGDDALGAVIVQWSDISTWGERPPDAGYIHPLRVRRRAAGREPAGRCCAGRRSTPRWPASRRCGWSVAPMLRASAATTSGPATSIGVTCGYTSARRRDTRCRCESRMQTDEAG